jgi:hypothetical protein
MRDGLRVLIAAGFHDEVHDNAFPGVGRIDDAIVERNSSIRHGRYYGRAACLVAATAVRLQERFAEPNVRTGLVCNGGPWNLRASWTFLSRARDAGPAYINPLQFPATLVSATATAAGSVVGSHAFSYVIGHDHFAFFETLLRAAQAIRLDLAERVLAIGVSTCDDAIKTASDRAGLCQPVDVALGLAIDGCVGHGDLRLLEVGKDERLLRNYPSAIQYEAECSRNGLSFPLSVPIFGYEALGATAAILIVAAAIHHAQLPNDLRAREFAVALRDGHRFMAAVFKMDDRPICSKQQFAGSLI